MNSADIIASLVASYNQPTALPSNLVQIQRAKKPAKVAAESSAVAAPKQPGLVSIPLPKAGTIDAKEYFVAMRRATDRNDRVRAISAYIGYDASETYSSNEVRAQMAASRAVRPIAKPAALPGPAVSIKGFVAGTCDMRAKRLADLKGREQLAAETMADHIRAANAAKNAEDAHYAKTLANVEADRLKQIRSDLAAL